MSLTTYPRALSDGEWSFYSKSFPNLQRQNVTVLGPKNQQFNCISWSLGFEDRWIDVGDNKEGLATLYAHYYYKGCDTASAAIDVYAVGQVPKHAAKLENVSSCTSKMQVQNKLRHHRLELEDNKPKASYGTIYGHFMKDASHPGNSNPTLPKPDHPNNHELPPPLPVGQPEGHPPITPVHPQPPATLHNPPATPHPAAPATPHPAPPATHPASSSTHPAHPAPSTHPFTGHPPHGVSREAVSNMRPFDPIPPPAEATLSTVHQLHTSLSQAFAPAVTNFESLYATWKATWFSPEMAFEPNSSARARGPAFDALVKLGPAIIPLVVHKLAGPDEFFAVQLYNALEKDSSVKVDPSNILDHNILQRHANLILDMNHHRNEAFAASAAQWQGHQDENSLSANSTDYVSGDAYKDLVKMGPGIIGHVLSRYGSEQDGWWHELLQEIVHGQPSGRGTFFKKRLFEEWKEWFDSGMAHEEAPKSG